MNRHLIIFCLTLLRDRDTIFKIVDFYYACQNENGARVAFAMRAVSAVGANGTLDLASTDRITESEKSYEQVSGAWYLASVSEIYPDDNSATPITNSVIRERLAGFAANTIVETVSSDAYGSQTTASTVLDRSAKKVTQTTTIPDSSSNMDVSVVLR